MKTLKKMLYSLIITTMIAVSALSSSMTAYASDEESSHNLDISIDFKKEAELPLTMNRNTEVFYFNGNINPGDKMYADIIVRNNSDQALQYTLSDIVNQLDDDEQAILLLDVLNLKITEGDKEVYNNKCSKITSPVIPWTTLEPGTTETIKVEYEFDKWADNTYQGANMRQKWIFKTQADIVEEDEPDSHTVDVSEPNREHEDVKTGVEEEKNNYAFIIIGIGVLIAGGYIAYEVISSKKKNKEDK